MLILAMFSQHIIGSPDQNKKSRKRNETVPDQWQTQILLRVLKHAHVIYISSIEDEKVEKMKVEYTLKDGNYY